MKYCENCDKKLGSCFLISDSYDVVYVNEVGQIQRKIEQQDKEFYFCDSNCVKKLLARYKAIARLEIMSDMKSIIKCAQDYDTIEMKNHTQLAKLIFKFVTKKISLQQFSEQASDILQVFQDNCEDEKKYLKYVNEFQHAISIMEEV
jgi:hypothetical protein